MLALTRSASRWGMTASSLPTEAFQVSLETAQAYEATFVPAFFAQWAAPLCRPPECPLAQRFSTSRAGLESSPAWPPRITGPGCVAGLDLNEAMLAVARSVRPDLDWRQGDVVALPFPGGGFDAVVCQMAMMFFPDRLAAVREMARVASPGGRVAVLVPGGLAAQPAYGPFVAMAAQHAGSEAQSLLSTYFSCGDVVELLGLFQAAGLTNTTAQSHHGAARFGSTDALVETEVRSTPLAQRLSPQTHERIREGAREVLAPFTDTAGRLTAPFECQIVAGTVAP